MEYSYKFCIYTNPAQLILVQRTFGGCRFIFNRPFSGRVDAYRKTGFTRTRLQQDKAIMTLNRKRIGFVKWIPPPCMPHCIP